MTEQWMSIIEYARAFSISDMTIRRRIKSGKVEAVLRDGKYFIPVTVTTEGKLIPPKRQATSPNASSQVINMQKPMVTAHTIGTHRTAENTRANISAPASQQQNYSNFFSSENSRNSERSGDRSYRAEADQFNEQTNNTTNSRTSVPSYPEQRPQKVINTVGMLQDQNQFNLKRDHMSGIPAYVDGKELIEFCQAFLKTADEKEILVRKELESKIATSEEKIKVKELEVKQAMQKIEDLQLLIKIIENKASE